MTAAATEIHDVKEPGTGLASAQKNGLREFASAPANSITELLSNAIDKGASVEQLEKLVGLYERVEAKQAAKEFANAMAAFQQECRSIKRSKTANISTKSGSQYSYTYAPIDEIANTANPILAKYGLSYTWDTEIGENKLRCICTVRHVGGHSQMSALELPIANPNAPGLSPQQLVEAAESIAHRRTLASALGLTTTDSESPSSAGDLAPISEDQATLLADLVKESGTRLSSFLKFMGVEKLSEIPVADYQRGVDALEEKKRARMAAGAEAR